MDNNNVKDCLDFLDAEETSTVGNIPYKIELINASSGVRVKDVYVDPNNILSQLLKQYGEQLGLNMSHPITFTNKRTCRSSNDLNSTVSYLELMDGDVLALNDAGFVA